MKATHESFLHDLRAILRRPASPPPGRVLCFPPPQADYVPALERSAATLRERQIALDRERAEAGFLLAELTRHRPERRALVLAGDPRFHTWGLLEKLLEESQETRLANRIGSERLAVLALALAERLDAALYGEARLEDLKARAWSFVADARRLRADFAGAGEAFDRAHDHLRRGTGDSLERAWLLDLEAALRHAEQRRSEAKRLLRKAIEGFLENGEEERATGSLIHLAIVHRSRGELARALSLLQEAQRQVAGAAEPRLLLATRHQLIATLLASGRLMEARGLLVRCRALYRQFPDPWTQSHLRWLRGRLALAFAETADGEADLLGARQGFLAQENRLEAALVALDLCALYARQDRAAELRELAEDARRLFRALPLPGKARTAESYLRQAEEIEGAWWELARAASAFE
ncbi:MAG TPA: hypothetical protein DD490_04135 [Acidobacteria bacterium]|nr:hypothetical protein [Acidobacteriota bacterium]